MNQSQEGEKPTQIICQAPLLSASVTPSLATWHPCPPVWSHTLAPTSLGSKKCKMFQRKLTYINDSMTDTCSRYASRVATQESAHLICFSAFQNWEADHVSSSSRVQRTASAGRTFVQVILRYTDSWKKTNHTNYIQLIMVIWCQYGPWSYHRFMDIRLPCAAFCFQICLNNSAAKGLPLPPLRWHARL